MKPVVQPVSKPVITTIVTSAPGSDVMPNPPSVNPKAITTDAGSVVTTDAGDTVITD